MNNYKLIQHNEIGDILDIARLEGWIDECFIGRSFVRKTQGYLIPIYRIQSMGKITRQNISSHLFDYQLSLVKKTTSQIIDDDKWRFNWTITNKEYRKFRGYAIPLLRKTYKCNKKKAEENFDWFFQQFGLRIKN